MDMPTQDIFRDSARDFLRRGDQRQRVRRLRDSTPGFERATWNALAEAGWLSVLVPEARGGLGLGLAEAAAIGEEIGRQLLPEPYVGALQAVSALCRLPENGSGAALLAGLLAELQAGSLVAGLAWQEGPGQMEPDDGITRWSAHGEYGVLNGKKCCVSPGSGADGWLVSALGDGDEGGALLWVPAQTPGVTLRDTFRIDGSCVAEITFTDVALPASHVLGSGAAARAAVSFANDTARIVQGAELLGVARQALDLTLDYVKTRVQFGKPVGSFQSLQHRLVDAYLQTELAAAALAETFTGLAVDDERRLPALASRIKSRCADAATAVTQLAIQLHGAIGFTDECDIGLYYKRALHLASLLGNAPAHRARIASGLAAAPQAAQTEAKAEADYTSFPRSANWDAMPEREFRQLLRSFFRQHFPEHLRNVPRRLHWHETREWYLTLSRQGWIAPAWPAEFGGMGLGPDKLLAFIEEQERYGVARVPDAGITMAGPILIRYGTPQQQAYYLPKILSGEHIWSQGYSEPGAGSDLAALRTEAVRDGDDFIVNGQKTWTTLAQDSTHIFMLVRTDKNAKKQAGISFLLADIASPGITVRPIKDLVGHEHFCEVFFDNVRVPVGNLVGELNQGWTIAKALLGFERIFLGSPKLSQHALARLRALADARRLFDDPVFRERYVRLQLDVDDLSALYARFSDLVKRGLPLPASVSLLKIWSSETCRRIGIVLAEAADEYGGNRTEEGQAGATGSVLTPLINSASATIYGGSNEIQRNIIARAVLGLPD
ncbi:MAG: acyl-CoA dehydrogenase [Pseudomonadota bacterium]